MMWVMSDGTEVDLGGEVRGASAFAQDLRELLSGRFGPPGVSVYPQPAGDMEVDLGDPTLLDMWLFQRGTWGRAEPVRIVQRPEFERRVFEAPPDDTPPGAVN
jgi:hypothetical protein